MNIEKDVYVCLLPLLLICLYHSSHIIFLPNCNECSRTFEIWYFFDLSEIYGKSENGMVNSLNTRVHELEIVLDEICCYVTFIWGGSQIEPDLAI